MPSDGSSESTLAEEIADDKHADCESIKHFFSDGSPDLQDKQGKCR
jgi:hypothetical protein